MATVEELAQEILGKHEGEYNWLYYELQQMYPDWSHEQLLRAAYPDYYEREEAKQEAKKAQNDAARQQLIQTGTTTAGNLAGRAGGHYIADQLKEKTAEEIAKEAARQTATETAEAAGAEAGAEAAASQGAVEGGMSTAETSTGSQAIDAAIAEQSGTEGTAALSDTIGAGGTPLAAALVAAIIGQNVYETGGRQLASGKGTRKDYLNTALNVNPFTAGLNPITKALGMGSVGSMVFGAGHKDTLTREAIKDDLKNAGLIKDDYLQIGDNSYLPTMSGNAKDSLNVDENDPRAIELRKILLGLGPAMAGSTDRYGDVTNWLTNALLSQGLQGEGALKAAQDFASRAGYNLDNMGQTKETFDSYVKQGKMDQWEADRYYNSLNRLLTGNVADADAKSNDPLGIGYNWISPETRDAFIQHVQNERKRTGTDPSAPILNEQGYIVDPAFIDPRVKDDNRVQGMINSTAPQGNPGNANNQQQAGVNPGNVGNQPVQGSWADTQPGGYGIDLESGIYKPETEVPYNRSNLVWDPLTRTWRPKNEITNPLTQALS